MYSPFPGMDPYLESSWEDVHSALVPYLRDAIQIQLPHGLVARLEQRTLIEHRDEPWLSQSIVADVGVTSTTGNVATLSPADTALWPVPTLRRVESRAVQKSIRIIETRSPGRLVTVVELLSRSNKKPGAELDRYRAKVDSLIDAGVGVVEINLLRAGTWAVRLPEESVPLQQRAPYYACVTHATGRDVVSDYYAFAIEAPLGVVPIPLRASDPAVQVRLQPLIDRVYEAGAYAQTIDYAAAPDPPLAPEHATWADSLLRTARLR